MLTSSTSGASITGAGSRVHFTVETARLLRPEVALLHVRSVLDVPEGPLAGQHRACFSLALTKEPGRWEIAAFQNTLEAAEGRSRSAPIGRHLP
jgi:uncharacterized protein (TIGR02246 family)